VGKEIERKFLVRGDAWKSLGVGTCMRQGYLSTDPDRVVRVRIDGDVGTLTIKGRTVEHTRGEWEYSIPVADAEEMLTQLCLHPLVEKIRYRIMQDQMLWEVDEFLGENAGLVVAEIELISEDQVFIKPEWIADEVSDDARYFNANLLRHPYSKW
jgi:adenylate cyclase